MWTSRSWLIPAAWILLVLTTTPLESQAQGSSRFDRPLLIQDVRQLAELVEAVHPDPYLNGGGKIAFHRRLQDTIGAIPREGMSHEEFYRHLRPFVAAVGDAHTWLRDPYRTDYRRPGGIPLYFDVVQDTLYVAATPDEHKHLIGARLVAVEGVPLAEIVARQGNRMGAENQYLLLRNLGAQGVLWKRCFLEHLIPEWTDRERVRVVLEHPDGQTASHVLSVPAKMNYPLYSPPSKITLPSRKKCEFVYDSLHDNRKTILLVIDGMTSYREVFEYERAMGMTVDLDRAGKIYKRYTGKWWPPNDQDKLLAGLPSAAETFRSLVEDMKAAGTERLLIDVRSNDGGASTMADFLVYFLYGRDKLLAIKSGRTEIRKLSRHYFDRHKKASLDEINRDKPFALRADDYDLGPRFYEGFHSDVRAADQVKEEFESLVAKVPSFGKYYQAGDFDAYYHPKHVVVLCSPHTFSSGWTLMYYLHRAGALVVGTPSSQAGNCFGDILPFKLSNSGIRGIVSQKRFEYFPDDPAKGRVLKPDYVVSYDKLASYNFDPNFEILHALEVLDELDKTATR